MLQVLYVLVRVSDPVITRLVSRLGLFPLSVPLHAPLFRVG